MASRRLATLAVAAMSALAVFTAARAHAPSPERIAAAGRAAGAHAPALVAAKREQANLPAPVAIVETPAGTLRVVQPELVAATFGQKIRFELTVEGSAPDGSLHVGIPARWRTRTVSGLVPSKAPRATRAATGIALRAEPAGAALRVAAAKAGARMEFEVVDTGIPASAYRLPVTWTDAFGTRSLGALEVRLYAPSREAPEFLAQPAGSAAGGRLNVTDDGTTESETFVTVSPNDANRVLVGANGGSTDFNAWLSTDGGLNFTELAVPQTLEVPGATDEPGFLCCDPFSMADDAGNLWYGGLALDDIGPSRITITRIPAGTSAFTPKTVGLPERTGAGIQDKPMGAIDLSPTSPHYGRLYVVWDEPASPGVNVVMTMCDTRELGLLNAALCDDADNWTAPVTIAASGSYIYAEVAPAPDGTLYVIWWNYSAANAIQGKTCSGLVSVNCASASSWPATPTTIAMLDATGGQPIPFACPIPAQPGGRAAPATAMDVDRTSGRVYVTWSDLRSGSGSSRCADGTPPSTNHLTWDSFVATATNALPGGAVPSATAGTRIITDGEGGGQPNSDEWFPAVAVDQSTGQAWANVYSTRDDATRQTMHVYARPVSTLGAVGALTKVSALASDYSDAPCCGFGNDYGDYNGIDAVGGGVFVVWSDKSQSDGEVFFARLGAGAPPPPPPPPPAPPPPPPPNLPPTASITAPDLATAGAVRFDASGSSDPDGAIVRYQWDADGDLANGFEVDTGAVPRLTATLPVGSRNVRVRVTDNRGSDAQASKLVVLRPAAAVRLTSSTTIRVRNARFSLRLAGCSLCTGRATATAKRVAVGSKSYNLGAASRTTVTLKVSKAAQRLLRNARTRRLTVTLKLTVSNGAGGRVTVIRKITLRR